MWGIIIGLFVAFNIISTAIILSACILSGRQSKQTLTNAQARVNSQMELASAIAKLRQVEPLSTPAQA